jgi:hypothetical protein
MNIVRIQHTQNLNKKTESTIKSMDSDNSISGFMIVFELIYPRQLPSTPINANARIRMCVLFHHARTYRRRGG